MDDPSSDSKYEVGLGMPSMDSFEWYAWKIVRVSRTGHRMSGYVRGEYATEYRWLQWVSAQPRFAEVGYHLLVYSSIRTAVEALKVMEFGAELWKCKIRGTISAMPPCGLLFLSRKADGLLPLLDGYETPWPEDTVMAKEVRLEEMIAYTNGIDVTYLKSIPQVISELEKERR